MIFRRKIFKLKNICYGDKVCIYEFPESLYTIALIFENKFPILDIPLSCPQDIGLEIYKQCNEIVSKIKTLGEVYIKCDYLFTYYNNELNLLSYASDGIPFSRKLTKMLAEKINLSTFTPVWEGKYNNMIPYAFLQDIFIQKSN